MAKQLRELWPLDHRGTHTLMVSLALVFGFWFVVSLKAVFTPFFIALIFAYIFNPFVNFGEKFKIPRWWCTFLIFFSIILAFLMIILVVLPSIQHEFIRLTGGREMMRELPYKISANLKVWAMSTFSPEILEHVKRYISDWETAVAISSDWAKETLVLWGERFFSQIGTWTSWVMDLILIPFYLFFLLTSLNRFWSYAQNTMIPYDHRDLILRILAKVHRSLSAFFRGRLLVCLIISVSAWMGLLFLGVPFSFILGFGIGFATIVPLMGIVFLVPAMIAYSLVGAGVEEQALLLLLYAALQGMEMFVLTPFILGKEVELHPMALVMSILICGYLFGGIGVVLAVPIASTAKILFEEFVFPSFVELSKKHPNSPKVNPRKGSS